MAKEQGSGVKEGAIEGFISASPVRSACVIIIIKAISCLSSARATITPTAHLDHEQLKSISSSHNYDTA